MTADTVTRSTFSEDSSLSEWGELIRSEQAVQSTGMNAPLALQETERKEEESGEQTWRSEEVREEGRKEDESRSRAMKWTSPPTAAGIGDRVMDDLKRREPSWGLKKEGERESSEKSEEGGVGEDCRRRLSSFEISQ